MTSTSIPYDPSVYEATYAPASFYEKYLDAFQLVQIIWLATGMPSLPNDQKIKIVSDLKFGWLIHSINKLLGKELLAGSKKQALLTGKTWYLLKIDIEDWMKMDDKPLNAELLLDVRGRGVEKYTQFLQTLDKMNAETHYMISLEIFTPENVLSAVYTLSPSVPFLQEDFGEVPWKVSPKIVLLSEASKICSKKICHACLKIDLDGKFLVCGKCRERRYCSKACQLMDWRVHKERCVLLAKIRASKT